jgi:hypothetical protein
MCLFTLFNINSIIKYQENEVPLKATKTKDI